jgi:predicted DNA repair protein MutK
VPVLAHAVVGVAEGFGAMGWLVNTLASGVAGLVAGGLSVMLLKAVNRLRGQSAH